MPATSRLRERLTIGEATPVGGGCQALWNVTLESKHTDKPARVANAVARWLY